MATNTKSGLDPKTYKRLREECRKLLELAEKLEQFASAHPDNFSTETQFIKLKVKFDAQFDAVHGAMV